MSTAYISVARVKEALRSSYDNSDDNILNDLIVSASAFLDTYCGRSPGGFSVQSYDELYHGTGEKIMFTNNTPIVSIQRIATTQLPALSIRNTDSDMGTRALVSCTATGITLTYVKNAVTSTNTITFASNITVNSVVSVINAVGNNWSALAMGGFGTWASADLRATQGAFGSRITTSYLWIHWFDLPQFRVNETTGEIYSDFGFARGMFNWRLTYSAGYQTFPDDLGQALAELVVNAYYARELNSNLQSESLGGMSYSQLSEKMFEGMSVISRNTLSRYKTRRIPKFSTW